MSITTQQFIETEIAINLIKAQLKLLREMQILGDAGIRQQQSVANDEIMALLKDIADQMSTLLVALKT